MTNTVLPEVHYSGMSSGGRFPETPLRRGSFPGIRLGLETPEMGVLTPPPRGGGGGVPLYKRLEMTLSGRVKNSRRG